MDSPARDLTWLPDRHLSVAATLAHADDLIDHVCQLSYAYGAGDETSGPIDLEEVPGPGVSYSTIRSVKPLPRAIALYTADALTTLRAAVEHVLYAEARHLIKRDFTSIEERLVEMPARTKAEEFDRWVIDRTRKKAPSSLITGPLLARVRELQPYHRKPDPLVHPLALLASHSNFAKHREAALAAAQVAFTVPDDAESGVSIMPSPAGPAKPGDILAATPFGIQVPASIFSNVGIRRPDTGGWVILLKELGDIAAWVRTVAIPTLITGTADVDPLPASLNTSESSSDERLTIAAGSWETAVERSSLRMAAFTARDDLGRLLTMHPEGAAHGSAITFWLESLGDRDVLDRAQQLAGAQPSPENAWEMFAVAGSLIEEAVQHGAGASAES